jgi:hypothetical protein
LVDIQQELETKIYQFFEDHIRDNFSSTNCKYLSNDRESQYSTFFFIDVFDVYIQQDRQKVWLVDFNPFAETTDGLLYEWDELLACK